MKKIALHYILIALFTIALTSCSTKGANEAIQTYQTLIEKRTELIAKVTNTERPPIQADLLREKYTGELEEIIRLQEYAESNWSRSKNAASKEQLSNYTMLQRKDSELINNFALNYF